jgi:hypothetical protein
MSRPVTAGLGRKCEVRVEPPVRTAEPLDSMERQPLLFLRGVLFLGGL